MGVPAPVPKGVRKPSHVAYYVALVGILSLLIMLCLYFFYYFVKKVKELSRSDALSPAPAPSRPPPAAYPVQPVVREGASAMAKLCKQVPPAGKGDTVFPTSTSPAALRASTGEGAQATDTPDTAGDRPGGDPRPDGDPRPEGVPQPAVDPLLGKPPPVPRVCVSAAPDVPAR